MISVGIETNASSTLRGQMKKNIMCARITSEYCITTWIRKKKRQQSRFNLIFDQRENENSPVDFQKELYCSNVLFPLHFPLQSCHSAYSSIFSFLYHFPLNLSLPWSQVPDKDTPIDRQWSAQTGRRANRSSFAECESRSRSWTRWRFYEGRWEKEEELKERND